MKWRGITRFCQGGKRIATITDKKGHYAFRSKHVQTGVSHLLAPGGQALSVDIPPGGITLPAGRLPAPR